MSEELSYGNRTEALIQNARRPPGEKNLIINPDYLDDENLPEEERTRVLEEIFTRNVRDRELNQLANHFAPILDNHLTNHLLICGPTGSGKTASIMHFLASLKRISKNETISFDWKLVELSAQSTCFAALNRMAVSLNASRSYSKGVPHELMQSKICQTLRTMQGTLVFFFDEIDNIVTDRDMFMTYLIKLLPRQVPVKLIYVFTTNRLDWEKMLDARVVSCMRKNDFIFNPYSAPEIEQILQMRVNKALDTGRVKHAALSYISAISAKHSGDARKGVELLAKAAVIADRKGTHLTEQEVDEAEKTLEYEKTISLAQILPLHQKLTLAACISVLLEKKGKAHSGEVYARYVAFAEQIHLRPISQRRYSDIINALDLYSLIQTRVYSCGRHGKRRLIENALGHEIAIKTMDQLLNLLHLQRNLFKREHPELIV